MATKGAVLSYLKHDRTIMQGRNLYNQFPTKSLATQSYISRLANTASNVKKVAYELCKLVAIPERQMNALLNQPLSVKPVEKVIVKKPSVDLEKMVLEFVPNTSEEIINELATYLKIEFSIPEFTKGLLGLSERKNFANELEVEVQGNSNADYDAVFKVYKHEFLTAKIEEAKEVLIESKLQELDVKTKESIKLRDQFPFLRESDCPRVLHLLVADLITAHETFVTQQPLLHQQATQEQLKQLVKEVKASYIDKKEVFAELEYYNEHKELLGEHPIFELLKQEEEIRNLNTVDLAKKNSNLQNNINRNKKKLESAENDVDKEKYEELILSQTKLKEFGEKELETRK